MVARDRRHAALVEVFERHAGGRVIGAGDHPLDGLGRIFRALDRALGDAGHVGHRCHVAEDKDVRVALDAQIGFDDHPAGPVDLGPIGLLGEGFAQWAGLHPGRPHLAGTVDPAFLSGFLVLDRDAQVVDFGHHRVAVDLHTHLLQPALRLAAEVLPHRRQYERRAVEQHHPALGGVDGAKRPGQCAPGEFGDLAGQFHSGGSTANHDEGQPSGPLSRVAGDLGRLERPHDATAQLQRIVDGLHAGGEGGEVVVAEIVLLRSGGHDEAVERQNRLGGHQP